MSTDDKVPAQRTEMLALKQPSRCFIKREFLKEGAVIERCGKFYRVNKNGSQTRLEIVKK